MGDGGLLESPVRHDSIQLAPAERFDVVVDFAQFTPGTVVTMSNALGENGTRDVMRFRVTESTRDDAEVPRTLSRIEKLDPGDSPLTRQFSFTEGPLPDGKPGWLINGQPYDPQRIDARPVLDTTEVWRFVSDVHHPIHEVAVHFTRFAGTYLLHCDHLEHEDMMMMSNFETSR